MLRFIVHRLLQSVLVLWLVYTCTFWLLMAAPGDPFVGRKQPPPAIIAALKARYGLNDPVRAYWRYPEVVLLHGDLGPTISYSNWSVAAVIKNTLPVSMALGALALAFALWLGVAAGLIGAVFKGRWIDRVLTTGCLAAISIPNFIFGSVLLILFAVDTTVLPSGGWGSFRQLILPAATLGVTYWAILARLMRESTWDVLQSDYIRTARAKGNSPVRILSRHAAPNASLPILAFLGPAAAGILTGSFVVEKLFAVPGMGYVFVNACLNKDIPLVLGITMVYTVILVMMNMLADVACAMADPRIAING